MGSELQLQDAKIPGLIVRPAHGDDVHSMAPRLRTEDVAEIVAFSGETALNALGRGYVNSAKCFTVEFEGRASAMFGVAESPIMPRFGTIWLLGTNDIPLFSRQFLRQSSEWLAEIMKGYDIVGNLVDERNESHIRWLRWLEFDFIARHPVMGHLGLPFLEFVKIVPEGLSRV